MEKIEDNICGLGVIGPDIPDSRDYRYAEHLAGNASFEGDNGYVDFNHIMPEKFNDYSLRNDIGNILNQGSTNSCTGHSAAYAMNILVKRIVGDNSISTDINPWWVYYWARKESNLSHRDGGAYMRSLMKALHKYGIYSNSMNDPYDTPGEYNLEDTFKLYQYFRLYGNDLNEIKYALTVEKLPLFACIAVYDNIDNDNGVVNINARGFQGYHAVCLTGIKTINGIQHIEFANSWGTLWGDNGFGYLPPEYVTDFRLTPDIYCPTYQYN